MCYLGVDCEQNGSSDRLVLTQTTLVQMKPRHADPDHTSSPASQNVEL